MAKSVKSAERQQRLAAALRENLKRRKAQGRTGAGKPVEGPDEAPSGVQNSPVTCQNHAAKSG